jgi:hypothetical protein
VGAQEQEGLGPGMLVRLALRVVLGGGVSGSSAS